MHTKDYVNAACGHAANGLPQEKSERHVHRENAFHMCESNSAQCRKQDLERPMQELLYAKVLCM
eukprot:scaffold191215_cov21-Tisochrysis_lutea.AAC.2